MWGKRMFSPYPKASPSQSYGTVWMCAGRFAGAGPCGQERPETGPPSPRDRGQDMAQQRCPASAPIHRPQHCPILPSAESCAGQALLVPNYCARSGLRSSWQDSVLLELEARTHLVDPDPISAGPAEPSVKTEQGVERPDYSWPPALTLFGNQSAARLQLRSDSLQACDKRGRQGFGCLFSGVSSQVHQRQVGGQVTAGAHH